VRRRLEPAARRSLAPFAIPNYRRYYLGQLFARCGVWVQTVGELWLVLRLTDSGFALGLTTALQFSPMLLVGAWSGVLADRLPKRPILVAAMALMVVPATALLALTVSGAVELWMVYALVLVRGVGHAFDHPVRQAFVMEIVGPRHVAAAVSLNAALVSSARLVGPAVGGILIAAAGVPPCFALSAVLFAAAVLTLAAIDERALRPTDRVARAPGQVRAGLRYVRATPALRLPLGAMTAVGTLAFNFPVVLPLMARFSFHAGAGAYGALAGAMGAGAIGGSLVNAARRDPGIGDLSLLALAFGVLMVGFAAAPSLPVALLALVPLGAASTAFSASVNSVLQLASAPLMRGRVMALYSVVFLGSAPVGGPIVGWISQHASPRAGVLVGAAATLGAAGWLAAARARGTERESQSEPYATAERSAA
jgi:MFS family permease